MAATSKREIKTPYTVDSEVAEEDHKLLYANGFNWKTAAVDILVAFLPLYFVAYAIAALIRDDTLANSIRNAALFQMAKLNPTIFPIVFTLVFAKFLKGLANWKLERGITVGHMQHLLGSRSLVNSVLTPIKLRTLSLLVPVLILVWILNPIGGQLSLRTISKESKFTSFDTSMQYADPGRALMMIATTNPGTPLDITSRVAFDAALVSPDSTKNGSQDVFGNVHIPMLEYLHGEAAYQDADGWYYTSRRNLTSVQAAANHLLDIPEQAPPLYSSLLGVPFQVLSTAFTNSTNHTQPDSTQTLIEEIKQDFLGDDVVATTLDFAFETSYIYADCRVGPSQNLTLQSNSNGQPVFKPTLSNNSTEMASDGLGFAMTYDVQHTMNSTMPRRIRMESWFTPYVDEPTIVSKASCSLTSTFVEVGVHCYTQSNCTASRIRASKKPASWPYYLTVLDGTSAPPDWLQPDPGTPGSSSGTMNAYRSYATVVGGEFFKRFVKSTKKTGAPAYLSAGDLSPLKIFLLNPAKPFSEGADLRAAISEVGNDLISRRMTQLLNTYWTANSLAGMVINGMSEGDLFNTPQAINGGKTWVETIVLRCHKTYTAILIAISIGLVGLGLAAAYLETIRRGPDVLDDFVNSLRHSPYVREDMGPSMEDGRETAQRLKNTVIQMGDVRPDQPVGYVAIGTPNNVQPVNRLDLVRKYA